MPEYSSAEQRNIDTANSLFGAEPEDKSTLFADDAVWWNGLPFVRGAGVTEHEGIEAIREILTGAGRARTDDSGIGNIGSGWRRNLEVNLNTRFDFIGLPSAVLTFSYTYEESEINDPFTGIKRRLRFSTPDYFQISYRHDLEGTNLAYGFNAHRRSGRLRQDVSLSEVTDFEIHLGTAFIEYNFTSNVKVRFAGAHFLNDDARIFEKTFYEGNIADSVINRIDFQDWRIHPDYVLSLQATF